MYTETQAWTPNQKERWTRIAAHPIGGADASQEFVRRLRREQRWSEADADAALLEYRRFAFLACVAGHEVTPSKAVDAVWHLHLLHTRDYWQTFCPTVLGTDLHHQPSGGAAEAPRYRAQYAQTRASYTRWFGAPPSRWWPVRVAHQVSAAHPGMPLNSQGRPGCAALTRATRAPRSYGMRLGALLAGAALPALVWAARPANPLDWIGPEFLLLYLALMGIVVIVSIGLRLWLRRQAETSNRNVGELSPIEAALLAGGPLRAVDTAIADLHAQGAIEWDSSQKRLVRTSRQPDLRAPLDEIARAMLDEPNLMRAMSAAAQALEPVQQGLERRGLWLSREVARRIATLSALPAAALCAFGIAKIAIGISRDRPVTLLIVLCAITAVFALVMFFTRPGRSRLGDQEVARLRARYVAPGARPSTDILPFAVALGGSALLAGTALAAYHENRLPMQGASDGGSSYTSSDSSSGDSSSSDSGGSDGGGSSCGGCGGGGGD